MVRKGFFPSLFWMRSFHTRRGYRRINICEWEEKRGFPENCSQTFWAKNRQSLLVPIPGHDAHSPQLFDLLIPSPACKLCLASLCHALSSSIPLNSFLLCPHSLCLEYPPLWCFHEQLLSIIHHLVRWAFSEQQFEIALSAMAFPFQPMLCY